jgi:hypothetical protein
VFERGEEKEARAPPRSPRCMYLTQNRPNWVMRSVSEAVRKDTGGTSSFHQDYVSGEGSREATARPASVGEPLVEAVGLIEDTARTEKVAVARIEGNEAGRGKLW